MAKLPVVSGQQARKAFERAGWEYVRTSSSRHMIRRKQGSPTALSVPDHKTLDQGLLRSLIRDAGTAVDRCVRLL